MNRPVIVSGAALALCGTLLAYLQVGMLGWMLFGAGVAYVMVTLEKPRDADEVLRSDRRRDIVPGMSRERAVVAAMIVGFAILNLITMDLWGWLLWALLSVVVLWRLWQFERGHS